MADILTRWHQVRSRNPLVSLDFGGFAKGVALDMALQRLRSMGKQNAIINAGGCDLNVIGSHGDRPWKVGVRHPQGKGVLAAHERAGYDHLPRPLKRTTFNPHAKHKIITTYLK